MKEAKDIRMDNDVVGMPVELELIENFDESISHFKKNRVSDPHTDMGITGI